MTEVEKLYSLAGVETNKYKLCCTGCEHVAKLEVINGYPSKWICDKYDEVADCDKAEPDYEFTAEKQLELIKWLIIEGYIEDMLTVQISEENFEVCLADTFNELWQDLTEEERKQIKEILE